MNINYWFQILFWNHGQVIKSCDDALSQAEHWESSKLCPLWTVFISCVRHVPPIMKVRVHIDIVCYNNYYYLQSWESNAIFLFFVILGSLIKPCILFEINFSCSSPSPHPIQSWNLEKILDTHAQHCLWGEGKGRACVNWKCPEMQKCPKTFVHDCSRDVRKLLVLSETALTGFTS